MRFAFDNVTLDTSSRAVTVGEARLPLPPRLCLTLETLVAGHGRVISREELQAAVWPDTHVQANNVAQAVKAVRRALPPVAADRIRTLPRQGYCFAGPVVVLADSRHDAAAPARPPAKSAIARWGRTALAACSIIIALSMAWMGERRAVKSGESSALHQEGIALLSTRRAADLRRAAEKFAHRTPTLRHADGACADALSARFLRDRQLSGRHPAGPGHGHPGDPDRPRSPGGVYRARVDRAGHQLGSACVSR